MAQCQGSRAQMMQICKIFTYIWQENVAKISEVPGAPRNVNPTSAITSFVGDNHVLYYFSITIHLHIGSFYATKYFGKKLAGRKAH